MHLLTFFLRISESHFTDIYLQNISKFNLIFFNKIKSIVYYILTHITNTLNSFPYNETHSFL